MTTTAEVQVAGRYRLCEPLGSADLGVAWRGYDEVLQREIAVHEVRFPAGVSAAERDSMAQRTLQGARAVAGIDTPAAVRVFDIVEHDGHPWIVTELVRGRTLTEVLAERPTLPSAEVARIGLCLLEALECAHRVGVIHRDVKPSNVIVGDDGRIALTGFGIVTDHDDASAASEVVVGSPSYLAPERALGEAPSAESDLWSLAATLWTAAEGGPPYDGETPEQVLEAITEGDPPSCTNCFGPLGDLLPAMMDRDVANRPGPRTVRLTLERVCRESRLQAVRNAPRGRIRASFDRSTAIRAARPAEEERTWPLLVAVVVVMLLTAAALSFLLGTGPS